MSSRSPFTPESAGLVSQQILDDDGTSNSTTSYAIAGLIEAVLKVADAIDLLTEKIEGLNPKIPPPSPPKTGKEHDVNRQIDHHAGPADHPPPGGPSAARSRIGGLTARRIADDPELAAAHAEDAIAEYEAANSFPKTRKNKKAAKPRRSTGKES